tara:strand:+ start:84 stop:554 length:471 start_codon:yes stop_codon:yes gene_type:complete
MKTEIIDNWLHSDLVDYLENYFLYKFPHYYGHKSNDKDINSFYVSSLNPDDALNNFLFYKLKKTLNKNLRLERMYINIQHENMNGSFHQDEGDITCLYMVTKTLPKGEGCFEIKNEEKIDFIQNRLIAFDASKQHMGHAPNKGEVRITLAFKTYVS